MILLYYYRYYAIIVSLLAIGSDSSGTATITIIDAFQYAAINSISTTTTTSPTIQQLLISSAVNVRRQYSRQRFVQQTQQLLHATSSSSSDENNEDNDTNQQNDVSSSTTTTTTSSSSSSSSSKDETKPVMKPVMIVAVDEEEHDAAVMNRLLRPYQYLDAIQTIAFQSALLFVILGFTIQFFGYSYIIEYNNDKIITTTSTDPQTGITITTSKVQHTQPPTFRIGTIEERDFLQEIRKDTMK